MAASIEALEYDASCPLDKACRCSNGAQTVHHATLAECDASPHHCIQCNPGNSTPTALACKPLDRQCFLSATPSPSMVANRIGARYTLLVQNGTHLNGSFVVGMVGSLTVRAANDSGGARATVMVEQCPLVFQGAPDGSTLTITGLEIHCLGNEHPTAPGILVGNVTRVAVVLENITVFHFARSAVTVLGGDHDDLPGANFHVDLAGSLIKNVLLQQSTHRMFVDLTLAMFIASATPTEGTGASVSITGISRLMVQPAVDPATDHPSAIDVERGVLIYNFTEWTRIFGADYELVVDDDASLGFALVEDQFERNQVITVGLGVILGGSAIILIRYAGPVAYLQKLSK